MCLSSRLDANVFTSTGTNAESYLSVCFGKERIVFTATHIDARMELGAPLTNNDMAGTDFLSAVLLNA